MTGFYSNHLLSQHIPDKVDRYGRETGFFRVPNIEPILKRIQQKSPSYWQAYFDKKSRYTVDKYEYIFTFSPSNTLCTIQLQGVSTKGGHRVSLAQITIQTVNANCGSIIISNLYTELQGTGFASALFEEVLRYLEVAGYSFILLNTAGKYQNPLGMNYFWKRYGFIPMKSCVYVNKRSGNANVWYSKMLSDVKRVPFKHIGSHEEPSDDPFDYEMEEDHYDENDF